MSLKKKYCKEHKTYYYPIYAMGKGGFYRFECNLCRKKQKVIKNVWNNNNY